MEMKQPAYLAITRLARFQVVSSCNLTMVWIPSSSSSYNSVRISMRAAAGILWSSGNEPRSMTVFDVILVKMKFQDLLNTSKQLSIRIVKRQTISPYHQSSAPFLCTLLKIEQLVNLRRNGDPPTESYHLQFKEPNKHSYC